MADFAYLQSEEIPGFIAPRDKQQPLRPAGFDYDVLNAEVLLDAGRGERRPAGLARRHELSLPGLAASRRPFSPPVLRKIKELAKAA